MHSCALNAIKLPLRMLRNKRQTLHRSKSVCSLPANSARMTCRNRQVTETCDSTGPNNRTKYSYDGEGRRVQETTGLATALGWLAIMLAARPSVQDSCKTPRKTRRYRMDHGLRRALKTQPLSTRRYPLEPPFSGSSPVAPTTRLFRNIRRPVCYLTLHMAADHS